MKSSLTMSMTLTWSDCFSYDINVSQCHHDYVKDHTTSHLATKIDMICGCPRFHMGETQITASTRFAAGYFLVFIPSRPGGGGGGGTQYVKVYA